MPHPLVASILSASQRPELPPIVHSLYADLAAQISARNPICRSSGRCCHFDSFGHRLYVTTLELATFLHDRPPAVPPPPSPRSLPIANQAGGCPYQIDNLCSVHSIRPFGCRIFFCDETATDWQRTQYEHFHARLKQLHATLNVPYAYLEWRQALQLLNEIPPTPQT